MKRRLEYDLTYVTVDSLSEGVGSSQILPLMQHLSRSGLSINLISFEKNEPPLSLQASLQEAGVNWNRREFGSSGTWAGLNRLLEISREIPESRVIHARSDIPAVGASLARKGPILWDVRSLWAEQKAFIETNSFKKKAIRVYGALEGIASFNSSAVSTLTNAIVPILEERHRSLPKLRIVVPTAVDLVRFKFDDRISSPYKGLYSGTYNNYYDLALSHRFLRALQDQVQVEIHWARPKESPRESLNAGETFTFVATQNEMANIVANYSFGLSICKLDAGPSLRASMPTKVAEFLACGRPVVVNEGLGDFDKYIPEFRSGVVINDKQSNIDENVQALIELLEDPETPFRCRALAEKYFDIQKGAEKYLSVYKKIQDQNPNSSVL